MIVPQNIDAEQHVLAALLLAGADGPDAAAAAVTRVLGTGLAATDFYYVERHGLLFAAITAVAERGEPTDVLLVREQLRKAGMLDSVGEGYLYEVLALASATSNVAHWAALVVDASRRRQLLRASVHVSLEARNGGLTAEAHQDLLEALAASTAAEAHRERLLPGDEFILDAPADVPAVWGGASGSVVWARGEGLMLVGPDGVGKTTLCQQIVLGLAGREKQRRVLGMRVAELDGTLLYLALDRPAQAARSFRRMVSNDDRDLLRDKLIVWKGPLPFSVVEDPGSLARFATERNAAVAIIDSLKDVAPDLTKDEVGSRVNIAMQETLARGVEVLAIHHQRKAQLGGPRPKSLADVYGSRWLTAGMGSVVLLWGDPGDLVVELSHLKQPADEVGPLTLIHDHERGQTSIESQVDLLDLARIAGAEGLTVERAAIAMFTVEAPSRNQIEKARRKLERLVANGLLRREGARPDPVVYRRLEER